MPGFIRPQRRDEHLFHERLGIVSVVPADLAGHHRFIGAVDVNEPVVLADSRFLAVRPEIHAQDLVMREPDAAMMIVVGGAGMAHAGQ